MPEFSPIPVRSGTEDAWMDRLRGAFALDMRDGGIQKSAINESVGIPKAAPAGMGASPAAEVASIA